MARIKRRNNKYIVNAYNTGQDIIIKKRSDFRCMLFDGDNKLLNRITRITPSKAFNGVNVFAVIMWITRELKRNQDTIMIPPDKISQDLKMSTIDIKKVIALLIKWDILCNVVDEITDYYMINPMYLFKGNVDKFIKIKYYDIIGDQERERQRKEEIT